MTGNNSTGRGKLGTKRHILTNNKGILLSAVRVPASTHYIKAVTDVVDNTVIGQPVLCFCINRKKEKEGKLSTSSVL